MFKRLCTLTVSVVLPLFYTPHYMLGNISLGIQGYKSSLQTLQKRPVNENKSVYV